MRRRILAALLIAVLLAGCGSQPEAAPQVKEGGTESEQTAAAQQVYQANFMEFKIDTSYQVSSIGPYCVSGDNLFFSAACVTGREAYTDAATGETIINPATGEPMEAEMTETMLFRYDLNTGESVRLEDYHPVDIPAGMLGYTWISAMLAGPNGTFWIVENAETYFYDLPEDFDSEHDSAVNYYVPGESDTTLYQYNADGQQLNAVKIPERGNGSDGYCVDQAGNLYIGTFDTVYVLDGEGALLAELPNDSNMNLCQISPSEVGLMTYNNVTGSYGFRLIDPEAKDYGAEIQLPTYVSRLYPGFAPYRFLYSDNNAIYGYRQETDTADKLFSLLDYGIDSSILSSLVILSDGRIMAVTQDSTAGDSPYALLRMELVDASTLPQKQELTLACMSLSTEISRAVAAFNRTHNDVQITVQDYSEYNAGGDPTAGLTRLNTEIISGILPDILCTAGLPVDQYAAKGILADLWPLIDGDEELSREDLMTHFFDVLSIDGKLYQITDCFQMETAVGNAEIIGDRTGWTLDELLETMKLLADDAMILGELDTKDRILASFVACGIGSFIDWEGKTCSFDSQEFIDLLSFVNACPTEFDGESYDAEAPNTYNRFQANRQLLTNAYLGGFYALHTYAELVGGSPVYVGYPSASGSGSSFRLQNGLAISTACENMDQAWSFVRTFLTEEYQTGTNGAFPTNRHAFDAAVEEQMTTQYQINPDTGKLEKVYRGGYNMDGLMVDYYALTQEEYDAFLKLYEACSSVYTDNYTVYEIIAQETAAFFDGQKTAEETAKIIQDRVSLYVVEQG